MRYEDASHTGEFQGQGPIANDDLELVAAGQKSSATGNLITGEGTQSGAAGADSAAGAHITSIAGKGGEDSSFAGGKLSVMGDYGKLSVDADGNYIYQVNKGVENVRDRFTYTLADGEGASDSAALIVEIGKTPLVIQANAQQIVPGPDGVVTLPPGVELSDVHVVGRNLVIDMPDGTQLIIVDGAVFVPQLVLGGVEVPATNVAALLVGQEIQPAAGETPPSSGGNFAVPPPPLDPGVPLGDLIPPTEYDYIPPEPQPTFDILDTEPEAGVAAAQLDDDAQQGGIAGGIGDVEPTNSSVNGSLPGSGGDGSLEWDLLASGSLPAGFSFASQPNGDMWILQGGVHVLTITVDPDTGAYTVTQLVAIDHPAGGDENDLSFVINYSVTDEDGDVAIGSLTVNVDDDTPTVSVQAGPDANVILTTDDADTDGNPTDSDTASTTANFSGVFGGTTVSFGADGAGPGTSSTYTLAVTGQNSGLTSHGATINLFVVGGVVVGTTAGSAGAINAGNTIFTVSTTNTGEVTLTQFQQIDHPIAQDPTATTAPFNDQFISMVDGLVTLTRSETVVDGDGDQVTGSASINIGANLRFTDDGPSIGRADVGEPTLNVDETTFGTNDTESFAANFTATFGADGPGGISYTLGVIGANAASGLIDTLTGDPVVLNLVNGQVVGTAGVGGPVVFTVSVDANGNVTLDQSRAVIHDPDSGPDQTTTLSADNLVTLTATATDFDGDTDSETINIGTNLTFDDDAPTTTAATLAGTVDEDGVPGGIAGGTGDVAGESATTSGNVSSLFNSGADQPLSFGFAANTIAVLEALGLTSGGDALDYNIDGNTVTASTAAGDVFTFTLNANGSYTFTLLDQLDHPTLNGQAGDDTENDLSFNLGAIIEATDADGDSVVAPAGGLVITVDDDTPVARNDEDTVPAGGDIITGNVITGANTDTGAAGADSPGADAPAQIIGLASNNVIANVDNNPAGGFVVVGEFGTLTMQADGSYSYDRNPGSPGNVEDVFTYTYEDFDGDKVTATLTININDSAPTLPDPDLVRLDDDVIPGANGNNDGPGDDDPDAPDDNVVAGQLNGSGGDGDLDYAFTGVNTLPTGFSIGAGSDADTLLIIQDQGGSDVTVMTIELNLETGAFTVTQNNPIWHPTQNGTGNDDTENNLDFSIGVEVVDADGDDEPATITINVDDDTPTINVTKGSDAAVILTTDDLDSIGGATDTASTSANFGGVFGLTQSIGADGGAAATLSFTLDVTGFTGGPAGVDSGLDQGGSTIFLYEIGGKVVGSISATLVGVDAGNTVFDVAVSGTGVVTLTQYSQIDHPIGSDPTATGSPFADHIVSLADGLVTLTASSTITDNDGDSASDSETVNIGANLRFTDDGPDVAAVLTGTLLKLDETDGVDNVPGEVDVVGGNLGTITVAAATLFTVTQPHVSADTPQTLGYALSLSVQGVDSGLDVSSNNASIFLYNIGGVVYGSTAANVGSVDTATLTNVAFTVSINASTGAVTLTQYKAIEHSNTASNDEDSAAIAAGALNVVVTGTDFDGDTDTASVDLGSVIRFEDDGPTLGTIQDGTASNDPTDPVTVGTLHFAVGSDTPADVTSITTGSLAGITSGGKPLVVNFNNTTNVLTAYQDNGIIGTYEPGIDTVPVFTLFVDPAAGTSGQYTFDLLQPLDPTITDVPIGGSSAFGAGPDVQGQLLESATGTDLSVVSGYHVTGSFDFDAWFAGTPLGTTQVAATGVNGSTSGWGVDDNNFNNETELFLFDFGAQALADPDGPGGDPETNYSPPAGVTLPDISTATFDFINYVPGDDIAYVVHYTDGTFDSGFIPAINLDGSSNAEATHWKFTADAGKFIADIQFFSGVNNDGTNTEQDLAPGKIDLVSVGVQTSDLEETIDFNVTITDADGDPVSGSFSVVVSDSNTNSTPEALVQQQSFSTLSSESLLASDSGDENQSHKQAANSNTVTMAAAVAAAGMADSAAAAPPVGDAPSASSDEAFVTQDVEMVVANDSDQGSSSVAGLPETQQADEAPGNSAGHSQADDHRADTSLDGASNQQSSDQGTSHQPANDQGPAVDAAAAGPVAPAVAMVSAEALQAAGLDGNAQHTGAVEKVIAEALGQGDGHGAIDALLDAFQGGNGGGAAIANLAISNANSVSAWDMASDGGSNVAHEMLMKVGAQIHHDMVPPTQNG